MTSCYSQHLARCIHTTKLLHQCYEPLNILSITIYIMPLYQSCVDQCVSCVNQGILILLVFHKIHDQKFFSRALRLGMVIFNFKLCQFGNLFYRTGGSGIKHVLPVISAPMLLCILLIVIIISRASKHLVNIPCR